MSSRYYRLLIYDVKKTTKIDGMDPFNSILSRLPENPSVPGAPVSMVPRFPLQFDLETHKCWKIH